LFLMPSPLWSLTDRASGAESIPNSVAHPITIDPAIRPGL
jgi:hypothetical protein